jgi:hypothetical protein
MRINRHITPLLDGNLIQVLVFFLDRALWEYDSPARGDMLAPMTQGLGSSVMFQSFLGVFFLGTLS